MALSDNLVAYYSLDEASGNAIDSHGSNDLTDNNTVGAGTGIVNGGRDFEDSSSESFSIADNADLSMGDIDFTVQAWVKLESKPLINCGIVAKWDFGAGTREYDIIYRNGSFEDVFGIQVSADGTTPTNLNSTAGSPSTGTWYCLHMWHDATNNQIGISVNAGTPDTQSYSSGVLNSTSPFTIGAVSNSGSPTSFFDGMIDEVGIWKRVLSSAERTELYNSGNGRDYAYIAGAGTFSATGSLTLPGLELTGTASSTAPVFSATAALELPGLTAAGTGTSVPPVFSATASLELPGLTVTGGAAFTPPSFHCDCGTRTAGAHDRGDSRQYAAGIFSHRRAHTAWSGDHGQRDVCRLDLRGCRPAHAAGPGDRGQRDVRCRDIHRERRAHAARFGISGQRHERHPVYGHRRADAARLGSGRHGDNQSRGSENRDRRARAAGARDQRDRDIHIGGIFGGDWRRRRLGSRRSAGDRHGQVRQTVSLPRPLGEPAA